jgi:hypothetical protein
MLMTNTPFKLRRLGESTVLFYEPGGGKIAMGFLLKDLVGEAWSVKADTLAVPVSCLNRGFFDLSTGMAGTVLRTLANYRITIAFIGALPPEFSNDEALRDYLFNANRGRSAWFLDDVAALEQKLAGAP